MLTQKNTRESNFLKNIIFNKLFAPYIKIQSFLHYYSNLSFEIKMTSRKNTKCFIISFNNASP